MIRLGISDGTSMPTWMARSDWLIDDEFSVFVYDLPSTQKLYEMSEAKHIFVHHHDCRKAMNLTSVGSAAPIYIWTTHQVQQPSSSLSLYS